MAMRLLLGRCPGNNEVWGGVATGGLNMYKIWGLRTCAVQGACQAVSSWAPQAWAWVWQVFLCYKDTGGEAGVSVCVAKPKLERHEAP